MRTKLLIIIVMCLGIGLGRSVSAADGRLLLTSAPSGGGLLVSLRLEPNESINAIEAAIRFDPAVLEVISVNDAGSPITLWIERPTVTAPGTLSFAGAIPGGVGASGTPQSTLFQVLFRIRKSTTTDIMLRDIKAYLHQPDAQSATLTASPLRVSVTAAGADTDSLLRDDVVPPQSFSLALFRSTTADGTRRFVAYATTDKESGLSRYEIRERRFGFGGVWRQSDSPALLEDQWGTSIVEVRAFDNAGNARIARIIPLSLWIAWIIIIIIVAIGIRIAFVRRKLRTLS